MICDTLRSAINAQLTGAEAKIWHGHPVWFLGGNPVVGYARLKDGIRLLFWSGQTFEEPGLTAAGKFKAANIQYVDAAQIILADIRRWLEKAERIQWDYKNIVKRRGVLMRLK
ncbi:MAG: DUF1801 domain-containing protein [Chakrabartia sp.]